MQNSHSCAGADGFDNDENRFDFDPVSAAPGTDRPWGTMSAAGF